MTDLRCVSSLVGTWTMYNDPLKPMNYNVAIAITTEGGRPRALVQLTHDICIPARAVRLSHLQSRV